MGEAVTKNELDKQVDRDGYGIVSTVVDRLVVRDLIERLNGIDLPRRGLRRGHFVRRFSTSHLHRIVWLHGIKTGHFLCGSGESNRGGDPGR